ncbi:MAG: type I-F CRISPR-associated protein Csy2 [Gammaproteobacteria bacterium]|nr:type I-F CRISPR-associated protein Csy2 [Gammaproteobacteria bacterium]
MNQYILISKLKIQNANAIAGFTWGFPAITHFLGYTHNIVKKLDKAGGFEDIALSGCAVIAHEHHVHTYGKYEAEFTQSRNPPYLTSHDKASTPPVIEEGKMNMTVSLLIGCDGNIGNRKDSFINWLKNICLVQRLAGGTVINEDINIDIISNNVENLRLIKRMLLSGFVLMERSNYLQEHYDELCKSNPEAELLDAWLDFSALKKSARPKHNLITKYLEKISGNVAEVAEFSELEASWQKHLENPYSPDAVPSSLVQHFTAIEADNMNEKLMQQWQAYIHPSEETDADWEYIPKPRKGYLVPIMSGYKAISPVYEPSIVKNTRDNETPVCFVEAVHTVGEWKSVHRIKTSEELRSCLWSYDYEEHWYLCKQQVNFHSEIALDESASNENSELDFY